MSFLKTEETIFCSLALGETYIAMADNLIQSVLLNSKHSLYLLVDKIDSYAVNYYGSRINFIELNDTNDFGLTRQCKTGIFNYNLKILGIMHAAALRPSNIVWLDSDTFLFTQWPDYLGTWFDIKSAGTMAARFRQKLSDDDIEQHPIIVKKLELMGIDRTNIDAPLPMESCMVFRTGHKLDLFLQSWLKYARLSYEVGATAFFEAVEIALAIHESGIDIKHINGTTAHYANCIRVLHLNSSHPNKLMNPFIL